MLACALWTWLGRRSLRRSAVDAPLKLPRKVFPPRNDWLLMLVVLLAVWAMVIFGYLGEAAVWLIWLFTSSSDFGAPWWKQVGSTASWAALLAAQMGLLAWIARDIWKNPASARRRLKLLVVVFIASVIADEMQMRRQLEPVLPFARYTLAHQHHGRSSVRLADPSSTALPLGQVPFRLGSHLWCADETRLLPQLGSGGAALLAWTLVRQLDAPRARQRH